MVTMRWYLVRHAASDIADGTVCGATDVSIRPPNKARIAHLRQQLPQQAHTYVSGLQRTQQTMALLNPDRHPVVLPAMNEQHFGLWEGRTWSDIGDEGATFWSDPATHCPPEGESFATVCQRVCRCLDRLEHHDTYQDILMVIHAGTIRAILKEALQLTPMNALRFSIASLGLTRLTSYHSADGIQWSVESVNL